MTSEEQRTPTQIGNSIARAFNQAAEVCGVDLRMSLLAVLIELVDEEIERDRAETWEQAAQMAQERADIYHAGYVADPNNEMAFGNALTCAEFASALRERAKKAQEPTTCEWPDCSQPALCSSGNYGGRLVCSEHFAITNGQPQEPTT